MIDEHFVILSTPVYPSYVFLPAMNGDGSILSELLLGLVHLSQEVDETFAALRHSLFRPVRELELTNRPRRAVASIGHLPKTNLRRFK